MSRAPPEAAPKKLVDRPEKGIAPLSLWLRADNWEGFEECLQEWVADISKHLAMANVSSGSVIDFGAVIIDRVFPKNVRTRIVDTTTATLENFDTQGINVPQVLSGKVGNDARAIRVPSLPLFLHSLLDQNVLFKET